MKTLMLLVQSFALFLSQSSSVSGGPIQNCTEKFMDLSLVTFRAQNIGKPPAPGWSMDNHVRVIQEYQFNCSSTNISSIILGIRIKENSSSRKAFPRVLVYRPRGNGSQYDLVEGSERYIYYFTSNVSTSGVFEYPFNPPIPLLGGDLLAVSQPPAKQSVFTILLSKGGNFFNSCKLPRGKKTVKLCSASVTNQIVLAYPKTSDENCVNSSNSVKMIFIVRRALRAIKSISLGYERQYLYPEMAFSCNGTITKWIYGAKVTNPISHVTMLPELQIWRKIGYSNYMKIGSSTVNGNERIGTKLYMFIPQPPLQFQEGDIFGIYVPNKQNTTLRLYTQEQNGPLNLVLHSHYPLVKVNGMDSLVTSTMKNFPLVTAVISVIPVPSSTINLPSSAKTNQITIAPSTYKTNSVTFFSFSPTPMASTKSNSSNKTRGFFIKAVFAIASVISTIAIVTVVVIMVALCCYFKRKRCSETLDQEYRADITQESSLGGGIYDEGFESREVQNVYGNI